MNEGTKTDVLVREEVIPHRPAVSVSLRTESVLDSSEDERKLKRREAQRIRSARWYQANKQRLKDENREKLNAWRKANPEKVKAQRKRQREKHPEKYQERLKRLGEWRDAHPARARETASKYRSANRDKLRVTYLNNYQKNKARVFANVKRSERRKTERLSEHYVRRKLSRNSYIHWSAWPTELVELKRAELKLKRLWRNQKTSTN